MSRTTRSRAGALKVWRRKIFRWRSGKVVWQTPASTAPRASRSATCSTRWNAPSCCPCRRVCSRCLKKHPAPCIEMATSSCNGLTTPCRQSMSAAKFGRAGSPGCSGCSTNAEKSSRFMRWRSQSQFTTDPSHLHSPYRRVVQQSLDHLLDRARLIGPQTGSWAEAVIAKQRGPIGTPRLAWAVGTGAKTSGQSAGSCGAGNRPASRHLAASRDLRALPLAQTAQSPQLDFLETHPLIRNLDAYRDCVPDCFTPATSPTNPT